MEIIKNPSKTSWPDLLARPGQESTAKTQKNVADIIKQVKQQGDQALFELTYRFDKVSLNQLPVTSAEIAQSIQNIDPELKAALELAERNICSFHEAQLPAETKVVETAPGVRCWLKYLPLEKVGLYIPGGTAPLFSSVLMLGIPARIAGCRELVLITPPDKQGQVHPAILYCAQRLGINTIYKIGGAQAIAALAYGTETIPKTAKIFGPGNQYVTLAKQIVASEGVPIDMPAGPSEVMVISDASADPNFVAADLLSQAEHGSDSQAILVSTSRKIIAQVQQNVNDQLETLPRKAVARQSLKHARLIQVPDIKTALEIANYYAPEHLIIMTANPEALSPKITNAGSVFLGKYAPESAGDYCSGTNHVLPTHGFARNYSGVTVRDFMKSITFQSITPQGLQILGPAIAKMAAAEDLDAHKNAVTLRLKQLQKDH